MITYKELNIKAKELEKKNGITTFRYIQKIYV